jgi:hypothetical protein
MWWWLYFSSTEAPSAASGWDCNFGSSCLPLTNEAHDGLNFCFGHAVTPNGHGGSWHAVCDNLLNGNVTGVGKEGFDI